MEQNKNGETQSTTGAATEEAILREVTDDLQKQLEQEKKNNLRNFRLASMLKEGMKKLVEQGKISEQDAFNAILDASNVATIDDLLYALSN